MTANCVDKSLSLRLEGIEISRYHPRNQWSPTGNKCPKIKQVPSFHTTSGWWSCHPGQLSNMSNRDGQRYPLSQVCFSRYPSFLKVYFKQFLFVYTLISIADLRCCVVFRCTTKAISYIYIYTYVHPLKRVFSPIGHCWSVTKSFPTFATPWTI